RRSLRRADGLGGMLRGGGGLRWGRVGGRHMVSPAPPGATGSGIPGPVAAASALAFWIPPAGRGGGGGGPGTATGGRGGRPGGGREGDGEEPLRGGQGGQQGGGGGVGRHVDGLPGYVPRPAATRQQGTGLGVDEATGTQRTVRSSSAVGVGGTRAAGSIGAGA